MTDTSTTQGREDDNNHAQTGMNQKLVSTHDITNRTPRAGGVLSSGRDGTPDDGSVSPSVSLQSSTLHTLEHDTQTDNNSTMHTIQENDISTDDPIDFSDFQDHEKSSSSLGLDISSTIELHPNNESLGGTSGHKFIKRPLNAYMIWTRYERKRLLKGDPKMKMNEVSKAIQMGERWKKMTDREKRPFFEQARKYQQEHKQVLQDHPELQYAPSKKKGPKPGQKDDKQSMCDSLKSHTVTPVASPAPRSTPAQMNSTLTNAQQQVQQQNQLFSSFQAPLNPTGMQLAQVLGAGMRGAQSQSSQYQPYTPASTSIPGSFLAQQTAALPQFFQSQSSRNDALLGGNNNVAQQQISGMRPAQILDQYQNALCQPAFPGITESVNPFGMLQPQYLLNHYYQSMQQQQQQQQQQNGQVGGSQGGQPGQHY